MSAWPEKDGGRTASIYVVLAEVHSIGSEEESTYRAKNDIFSSHYDLFCAAGHFAVREVWGSDLEAGELMGAGSSEDRGPTRCSQPAKKRVWHLKNKLAIPHGTEALGALPDGSG